MYKPTILQKIMCKLGEHVYDFDVYPMQSRHIWIDGREGWIHTYKCACCGAVRHDITFKGGKELTECHESILDKIEDYKEE